jgi:hypothetical protein
LASGARAIGLCGILLFVGGGCLSGFGFGFGKGQLKSKILVGVMWLMGTRDGGLD